MMKPCQLPLSVLLCLAAAGVLPAADATDAVTEMMTATFKITHKDSTATCFLIARPAAPASHKQEVILVTAAHVLEKMSGDECRLVLRERLDDGTFERKEWPLKIRSGGQPRWAKHPGVDVAALTAVLPASVSSVALPLDCLADEAAITSGKLRCGDEVTVLCYPAQLEATGAGFPVLRRGTVASFPLTPVNSHRTYLVDYSTFGGDSGAPVMIRPRGDVGQSKTIEGHPLVVGLVIGQHRQTDKVKLPYEERTVHQPLGLAIVVHAEFIRQTIHTVCTPLSTGR